VLLSPFPRFPVLGGDLGRDIALRVRGLSKTYVRRRPFSRAAVTVAALNNAELAVPAGSILGLAGESGSGKSTLARCIALLERPDSGEIWFGNRDLLRLSNSELRSVRRRVQLIFQDAARALNPRLSAVELVAEPLEIMKWGTRGARRRRALDLMDEVGLSPEWGSRSALEFSGGQRQRLALARALALEPAVLILDEALSALDLPLRVQMLNLLLDLKAARGLSYVFISHDLGLLGQIADEVAVMHQGRIVAVSPCP
jgi:ABC-type glutathione transport system ATPase component